MQKNKLPVITECADLKGTYVLLRSALNVPVKDSVVQNQFRLMRSLITIEYLVQQGARIILCGHIGREKENTLHPVYDVLEKHFQIYFSEEVTGSETKEKRDMLQDGEVLLIENLRRDPREKKNDADFSRALADLADIYVNDAFSASHRAHASLVGVPTFLPSYFGINFAHEYDELQKMFKPNAPSIFLLGGAKFDTKMPLVEKYLDIYNHVFVGGALANDFFKAKGFEIGKSLVSGIDLSKSQLISHSKIILPIDVVVRSDNNQIRTTVASDVQSDEMIVDAGPETIKILELFIRNAETILWNGPLGMYEGAFDEQTIACAKLIAGAQGYSVIGGGDTVAAIESLNCQEKYNFLSTAGGAMLNFLEHGTLPAIDVVLNKK